MDLALIGNGSYQALLDSQARVQWLCWPRFDSSFVLGALLDSDKGGEFSVLPVESGFACRQQYREGSPILETVWSRPGESFCITDFAPRFQGSEGIERPRQLIRRIRPIEGSPQLRFRAQLVSDYGRSQQPPESLHMEQSVAMESGEDFALDEDRYLVLSWGSPLGADVATTCESMLKDTEAYWQQWGRDLKLPSEYSAEVLRSAITLKLHQYEDTGALTAAATTSIPEHAGSGRNWDYRFCWPRDSYFTVDALHSLGSLAESERFADFLLLIADQHEGFQPLYGIGGESELEEEILEHLAGYRGDGPVRVGNQAYQQAQHDIYGEMLAALEPVYLASPTPALRSLLLRLAHAIEDSFEEADAGLWEKRNEPARHSFSLLMHWMGARSLQRIGTSLEDAELAEFGERLQTRARRCLDEECWNEEGGFYAETVGGTQADASMLFMISIGYLPEDGPRTATHLDALCERLRGSEGLFRRYLHDDGLGETHSSFTVCTLWYAEALAHLGRQEEARGVLEAVLVRCNHVGLLSEDIDPLDGSLWGNFPQTYSHVGIIRCALALSRVSKA